MIADGLGVGTLRVVHWGRRRVTSALANASAAETARGGFIVT